MIDPVRFISNLSTGLMGYEAARIARAQGHRVVLISGPTTLAKPRNVRFVPVISAGEMERAVIREAQGADILIMTAAVGDYVPVKTARNKIKRKKNRFALMLRRTHDIIARVGNLRRRPVLVGFSLETTNLVAEARKKLRQKRLDIIVAHLFSKKYNPFGRGKTNVLMMDHWGRSCWIKHRDKKEVARVVLARAVEIWKTRSAALL